MTRTVKGREELDTTKRQTAAEQQTTGTWWIWKLEALMLGLVVEVNHG